MANVYSILKKSNWMYCADRKVVNLKWH